MNTVQKLRQAVQQLGAKHISKAKTKRFVTGVNQLAFKEFCSLNAAGRKLGLNRWTGESKIRRTVTDVSLTNQLQNLLVTEALANRKGYWYCSLDHSQFGPFCIAVLAVSVRKGRAIPIWCQVNVSEAALIVPLLSALTELFRFLGEWARELNPVLVMDRWFASDKLFSLFTEYGIYFIARSKGNKLVQLPWDPSWWREPLGDISQEELPVKYRSHQLRYIRSDFKDGMKGGEPWFLLTNLPEEITRRQVLNRYAERFEIEEAFKDVKWLNRLEWQRVKKPGVIHSLLLFVFFGWWLAWRYAATDLPRQQSHPKKRLSWFRTVWEQLQAILTLQLCPLT